jgi:hypothetical protein
MERRAYCRVWEAVSLQVRTLLILAPARVAVHFITVTEKFAPHDIVLAISTPDELSDAALTSACTLHTAAPSSSSSSGSSRQQKLSWIQEAAEEGSQCGREDHAAASRPATASNTIPTILEPTPDVEEEAQRHMSMALDGAESVPVILEEKAPPAKPAQEISHVTIETVIEAAAPPDANLSDLKDTLKSYDKLFEGGPEPRLSSQTARPNYDELYDHYYEQYTKPKVKLGPRPRPSLEGKRPATSGSVPQIVARPKSSLPAGLRSATRKTADQKATRLQATGNASNLTISQPPPVPPIPDAPSSPSAMSFTSRTPASVRSMPVSAYSSHHRSMGNTQEKTRLMKALELRKKQMKAQVERQEKMAEIAAAKMEEQSSEPEGEYQDNARPVVEDPQTTPTANSSGSMATTKEAEMFDSEPHRSSDDNTSPFPSLESSGLAFSTSQADNDDLNSAASVSSPTSAQTQGSSGAPSTRPSSISEDETPVADQARKHVDLEDPPSSDSTDEHQSVDSLPTVVPEIRTPIPSFIHTSPQPTLMDQASSSNEHDQSNGEDARSVVYSVPQNDAHAQRRSRRESMLFVPTGEASPLDESQAKKRNRESVMMPSSKRQSWYETKERRRAMLDPLHVSAENSEAEYLSDDSFMEELQSATVHEAKPMSVSKSPITPFFTRKASDSEVSTPRRVVSQMAPRAGRPSPEQLPRKVSGPWPPQVNVDKVAAAKKITVSSGISQRIKALAEKSSRESVPTSPANALNTPSSTLAQRKSSFFASTPADTSPNGRSSMRLGSPAFLSSSTQSTPEKKQNSPMKATVYNVQRAKEQPESVQVTARIVRDERTKKPALVMPNETTPLDLHQSPLIIDHQKASWTQKSPTRGRAEPTSPKTPSTAHSREQSIGPTRTSSESSWRAFGRRMSESKSIHSHDGDDKRDDKKDKRESRTSKMFKRMSSSMSSMPWKNSSTNLTLPEQDLRTTSLSSLREPPPPVHVGDLNIQFPDTLLWKRRWVEIDGLGNLVLSPSRSNENFPIVLCWTLLTDGRCNVLVRRTLRKLRFYRVRLFPFPFYFSSH